MGMLGLLYHNRTIWEGLLGAVLIVMNGPQVQVALAVDVAHGAEGTVLLSTVQKTMAAFYQPPGKGGRQLQQLEQQAREEKTLSKKLQARRGVFVTLSHQGRPRACWGSLHPSGENLVNGTIQSTLGALTKEYRYRPITAHEWTSLSPQVTVVRQVRPIPSYRQVNPLRDGVMVQANGRVGIILPGEVTDAYAQVVQAKLKAGIQPGESFQLYRIEADVYK